MEPLGVSLSAHGNYYYSRPGLDDGTHYSVRYKRGRKGPVPINHQMSPNPSNDGY